MIFENLQVAVKLKNKDFSKVRMDSFFMKQKYILAEQARTDSLNRIVQNRLNSVPTKNTFGWIMACIFVGGITAFYITMVNK